MAGRLTRKKFTKKTKRIGLGLSAILIGTISVSFLTIFFFSVSFDLKQRSDSYQYTHDLINKLDKRLERLESDRERHEINLLRGTQSTSGRRVDAEVVKVLDGDTIRVNLNGQQETLRLMNIDTEETFPGGSKPVTALGKEATEKAKAFFQVGKRVTLEFPGAEPLETCLSKYRGRYDRLQVFLYKDEFDYQEYVIRQGLSPYFVKYGYAVFVNNHSRYMEAERQAQAKQIGIWNPNAIGRNYPALSVWWHMRAQVIDTYRQFRREHPNALVFDPLSDYEHLLKLAEAHPEVTIFADLTSIKPINNDVIAYLGGKDKRVNMFIPNIHKSEGQEILNLLANRYISANFETPNRGYAYITGTLRKYHGSVEILVRQSSQIKDSPPDINS